MGPKQCNVARCTKQARAGMKGKCTRHFRVMVEGKDPQLVKGHKSPYEDEPGRTNDRAADRANRTQWHLENIRRGEADDATATDKERYEYSKTIVTHSADFCGHKEGVRLKRAHIEAEKKGWEKILGQLQCVVGTHEHIAKKNQLKEAAAAEEATEAEKKELEKEGQLAADKERRDRRNAQKIAKAREAKRKVCNSLPSINDSIMTALWTVSDAHGGFLLLRVFYFILRLFPWRPPLTFLFPSSKYTPPTQFNNYRPEEANANELFNVFYSSNGTDVSSWPIAMHITTAQVGTTEWIDHPNPDRKGEVWLLPFDNHPTDESRAKNPERNFKKVWATLAGGNGGSPQWSSV